MLLDQILYIRNKTWQGNIVICYYGTGIRTLRQRGKNLFLYLKVYLISTRFHLHNHRSFYFNVNTFVFLKDGIIGNIHRCLATNGSKPCFALSIFK